MKEHPILMKGPMADATLKQKKTQTRRVMRYQPPGGRVIGPELYYPAVIDRYGDEQPAAEPVYGAYDEWGEWGAKCPYGQPGDLLWVKENFRPLDHDFHMVDQVELPTAWLIGYPADDTEMWRSPTDRLEHWAKSYGTANSTGGTGSIQKPSIHMPRWASRLDLEILEIRAEQIQDISEEDAIAEGIRKQFGLWRCYGNCPEHKTGHCYRTSATASFMSLWDSINLKRDFGWDSNPWVWVVTYKVVKNGR